MVSDVLDGVVYPTRTALYTAGRVARGDALAPFVADERKVVLGEALLSTRFGFRWPDFVTPDPVRPDVYRWNRDGERLHNAIRSGYAFCTRRRIRCLEETRAFYLQILENEPNINAGTMERLERLPARFFEEVQMLALAFRMGAELRSCRAGDWAAYETESDHSYWAHMGRQ